MRGVVLLFFFFRQNAAYELRRSDWSSDVCSSDLPPREPREAARRDEPETRVDDARRDDPDDAAVDDEHPVEEATADPAPDKTTRHDDEEVEAQAPAEPAAAMPQNAEQPARSEEHTSELQSLMRNSYAVFCLTKKKK